MALEKISITVNEDDGSVVVCANVTSPIISQPVAFSFNVTFSVTDVTGTSHDMFVLCFVTLYFTWSADSNDYGGLPATVTFRPSDTRECVSVSIEDDRVVENMESFSISLTGTTDRISFSGTTEIEIKDNDREWCWILILTR